MNTKKATKRALLTSVMALVMCVVMLVGTTFAWFTDTASTNVNRIVAGNLKVDILDANGKSVAKGDTKRALSFTRASVTTDSGTTVVSTEDILWEPNCTYLTEGFQIKNAGNLALKWKIAINKDEVTNGKVGSEATPSKSLLEVIDFSIVDAAGVAVDIDNFTGHIVPADDSGTNTGLSGVYKIKAHMDANAGNDYQNLTLNGITITVYATQDTVENDSFDNQYDKYAQYGERTVKKDAPVAGANGTYGLANSKPADVNTKNITYSIPAGNYDGGFSAQHFGINSTFNGNGSTFKSFKLNCGYVPTTEESTLVVSNLNVDGDLIITASSNNVVIYNCTAKHISVLDVKNDISVTIDGCKITGTPADQVGKNGSTGNNKYGIYITRAAAESAAKVSIINSELSGIKGHAIAVQSDGGTCDFTIKGNKFTSYGLGKQANRAAFKIWGDSKYAPNGTDPLNDAAKELAKVVGENNTFGTVLGENCVVADFYGKTVSFTPANP